ncbi:MAG: tripartite tricarboxylate transporter permease, partial [Nanoarchaeota archaeon]
MSIEIFIFVLIGILSGIITGLTPGIHVNLVSALLVSIAASLAGIAPPLALACFIIAMAVTHTFLDSIPSIFLGAPEESTALGVLPGHRFLLKGLGRQAVHLTIIGSLAGAILSITLFPFFTLVIKTIYPFIKGSVGWILLVVASTMIIKDRRSIWALFIFAAAGLLGVVVLSSPMQQPLFPLLSGMFGISTLAYSLLSAQRIPKQHDIPLQIDTSTIIKASGAGQCSGFLTAMLPGLGAGTAAVIGRTLTRKMHDGGFLILLGSITTVNFVLSIATLATIQKARNGAIVAVMDLVGAAQGVTIIVMLCVALFAAGIATILAVALTKKFCALIQRVSYPRLIISIMLF